MAMRMLADHRRVMRVIVMAVIVPMSVLVIARLVRMFVPVLLGNVEVDAHRKTARRKGGQQ